MGTEVCIGLTVEIDGGVDGCCAAVMVCDTVVDSSTADDTAGALLLSMTDVSGFTTGDCVVGSDL
jgi:hypothetical protein